MKSDLFVELKSVEKTLSTYPFFEGLSPRQLQHLSDCAMPVHFTLKEFIFREGDPADWFYLLQAGKVALESHVLAKPKALIETIEAGDILGWSWLFPPYLRHFDARALEPTDAVLFYATSLREECEADHEFGYELLKRFAAIMTKRLQATRWKLLGIPLKSCE